MNELIYLLNALVDKEANSIITVKELRELLLNAIAKQKDDEDIHDKYIASLITE